MKFQLDYNVEVSDEPLGSSQIQQKIEEHLDELVKIDNLYGEIVLSVTGSAGQDPGTISEPVVRLLDRWLRKTQWVIAGDTETIACMNSEHCFAFVPAGESVEVSLFVGDEAEVEEYLVEPVTVRLEEFVNASIELGDSFLSFVQSIDSGLLQTSEGCRELASVLGDVKGAWREHQMRRSQG
jgi:hypothetical protein